jgi:hypothetical protein
VAFFQFLKHQAGGGGLFAPGQEHALVWNEGQGLRCQLSDAARNESATIFHAQQFEVILVQINPLWQDEKRRLV